MLLNKIFQPLLNSFNKTKWQSRNLKVRKKAVMQLPVSDQETLSKIAMHDADESIRSIAVNKLSDLDLLQTIIMKGTNEAVKQTAQLRLFQLLCGMKHPIPDYTIREQIIHGSRNPALLEFVAANADQVSLRKMSVKKVNRDPLLGDIALSDENSNIRQIAAQQIIKASTLERVAKNSRRKDKRVYKIVKAKLDQLIEEQQRPILLAREVIDICDKLEKLHKRNRLLQEKSTFDNYVKRWQEIHNFANEEVTQRYTLIVSKINDSIDNINQQQHKEQEVLYALDKILGNLSNAVDELLTAQDNEITDEAAAQQNIENSNKLISSLCSQWNEKISTIQVQELLNSYNNKYFAILDLIEHNTHSALSDANHDKSLEKIQRFTEQAESIVNKSEFILEKTVSALQKQFNLEIENLEDSSDAIDSCRSRFASAVKILTEKLALQKKSAQQFQRTIENKIKKINADIKDGYVSKANNSLHKLFKKIDNSDSLSRSEKHNYHDNLKQIQADLGDLSSWRNWAHNHERENLVQKAQTLADAAQANDHLSSEYKDITSQIKELRSQWKKMRSPTSDEIWLQFNNACNSAYEQCTPFIEQQEKNRQENLKLKENLCNQLEDYVLKMGWPAKEEEAADDSTIDWIKVDKITKQARKEWSEIGFVDREFHRSINKRFDHSIEIIRAELKKTWHINQQKFYDLINKVEAVHETMDDDLSDAISKAKHYQSQWKSIGPISSYQRNKVWKKFRAACDVIFDKRQETIKQKNNENNEVLREKEAVCENLEALNRQPLNKTDLQHAFNDIKVLWSELQPQLKSLSREVNKRYSKAEQEYQNKIEQLILHEQQEQLRMLKEKADICSEIESLSNAGDDEKDVIQQLTHKWGELKHLPAAIEADMKSRFEQSLKTVQSDEALAGRDDVIQEELFQKQQLCLKYEIITAKDSPAADHQARMEMQVELLNSSMGHNNSIISPSEFQIQWYKLTNYSQDSVLEKRFLDLI